MKNIGMSILALMMFASCGKKEEKTTEVNTTTETKTVVVDTVSAKPAPEANGTSVKVGSDGVEVKSKDGEKSTTVDVSKGKSTVEIKK